MQTWMKLLALVAVLVLALADEIEDSACPLIEPRAKRDKKYDLDDTVLGMQPCFDPVVTQELKMELGEAKTMEDYVKVSKELCASSAQITTCMDRVISNLNACQEKRISVPMMILSHLLQHLFSSVCENEGERLAVIMHGINRLKNDEEQLEPFKSCIFKIFSVHMRRDLSEGDLTSETYLDYKSILKVKKCFKTIEDDSFKSTMEWLIDEETANLKCQHPDEDRLVLCSTLDLSKVKVTSLCQLPPLNVTNLYDHLQKKAVQCLSSAVNRDLSETGNTTDLDWLKEDSRMFCLSNRELFTCNLEVAGYAEACLLGEEEKQFHLLIDSIGDILERGCVDDGAAMSTIMHEVYRLTPEHGHAFRDCYKTVSEASKSQEGHAVSSKNMRFYHGVTSFKQCLVEKLHENNDLAKDVEAMMNDVLKKMKCVNPEDGTVVLCETIHEH